jgi:hypothetical protein
MPIGGFLDALPAPLFVLVHLFELGLGVFAVWRLAPRGTQGWAFALYAASQVVFLAFFSGIITLKMAVLLEQMMIMGLVIWLLAAREITSPVRMARSTT